MAEKKKKKGGGKKKKKTGENVYEALLEYKFVWKMIFPFRVPRKAKSSRFRISVIDKELEEWRFRVHQLEEENEGLMGRDAHLRDECATTMRHLVANALQFDKENISYPKISKEDVRRAASISNGSNPYVSPRCTRLYMPRWMQQPRKKSNCEVTEERSSEPIRCLFS